MKPINNLADRINQLIELADRTLATKMSSNDYLGNHEFLVESIESEIFLEFKASSLSFISKLYSENHIYYQEFYREVSDPYSSTTRLGRAILKSIKTEIDGGWLTTMKGLISAEIFSDFLEMAQHLLKEGYKDAAAVMAGSVLEEHLRQLCKKNGISIENVKDKKVVPKKADLLNSELTHFGIYQILDQKNVTAWLDLRNKAAHGKYKEYNEDQVDLLIKGVKDFTDRNSI